MADWQRTLNIKESWQRALDDEMSVQELAAEIASKLRSMTPLRDTDAEYCRTMLAEEFEDLSQDPTANTEDFDDMMRSLYDWGDTRLDDGWPGKKVCWIATTV